MSKAVFFTLVELIRPYAKERSNKVRKDIISLEKRLAISTLLFKGFRYHENDR